MSQEQEQVQNVEVEQEQLRTRYTTGFKNIEKERGSVKRDIIDRAEKIEKLFNLGDRSKVNKVGGICAFMSRQGEDDGLSQGQIAYMREVLADKYKSPYSENRGHLDYTDVKPRSDSNAYFNTLKDAAELLKKPLPEFLTREQVSQLRDDADDITHEVSGICKAHDIATIDTEDFNEFEDNETTANKHKDKISQEQAPKSNHEILQKLLGEEIYKVRDNYDRIGEGIVTDNYVSENKVLLEQLILKFNAINSLHRPLVDRKWQRDWLEWCTILENYHDQGGTYASSKSAVPVTDILDKNGKPEQRRITKEQIDATHDEYLNEMRFIIANLGLGGKFGRQSIDSINTLDKVNLETEKIDKYIFTHEQLKPLDEGFNPTVRSIIDEMRIVIVEHRPEINDLFTNYQDNERGFRAKRAFYMHDKLSDKA